MYIYTLNIAPRTNNFAHSFQLVCSSTQDLENVSIFCRVKRTTKSVYVHKGKPVCK